MSATRPRTVVPAVPTARLLLRPFARGDLTALEALLAGSALGAGGSAPLQALEWAERAERVRPLPPPDGVYPFAVVVQRSGRLAGACELLLGRRGVAEIGYLLGRRHWGRGYGTEIARALVAFGFDYLHLSRLEAVVALDNPRSRRVLEKAGFQWDALLPRGGRGNGAKPAAERYVRDVPR